MASMEELIEEFEDILADAKGNPFTNKVTVDVEALRAVAEDMRSVFPDEIKQAKMLAHERHNIMDRANREAEASISDAKIISKDLLASAEKRSKEMDEQTARRTEQLMKVAQDKAQQTVDAAKAEAARIASRENIVVEAQKQADAVKKEADNYLEDARKKSEAILEEANHRAYELLNNAENRSRELRVRASTYVNDIVTDAEYRIGKSYEAIKELQKSINTASGKGPAVMAVRNQEQQKAKQQQQQQQQQQAQKKKASNFNDPFRPRSAIDVNIDGEFRPEYVE